MFFPHFLSSRKPAGNILWAGGYILFYDYIYRYYMYETFDYMGVEYNPMNLGKYFLFFIVASFPLMAYRGFNSLAAGFSLLTYVLAYIPCIHALYVSNQLAWEIIFIYSCVFFVCMSSFFLTDKLYFLKKVYSQKTGRRLPFGFIESVTLLVVVLLLGVNIDRLQMVNLFTESDTLYDLRAEFGDDRARWMKYLIQWLTTAFFPLLLICYLKNRSYLKYGMVMAGYLIVFMMDMQKITFFLPFVLTLVYFLPGKNRTGFLYYFHSGLIGALIGISYLLYVYRDNLFVFALSGIFILRTQCISGLLFTLYIHFFENHPYTYYTHVNIVNWLTEAYPYTDVLGRAVSQGGMNANATFWITDGLAAMGWSGIIVISIIFIFFKSTLNSIECRYDRYDCFIIFLPAVSMMLNASLFTAVLSCGFLVLYLILRYVHIEILEIKR